MVNADGLCVRRRSLISCSTMRCRCVRRIAGGRLRSFSCFICTRVDPRREDHIRSAGTEEAYIRCRFFSVFCRFGAFDHRRTCTVSEENRGGAVLHREETGQLLRTDHEGVAPAAHGGETARNLEAIDEAAAGRIDVEGRHLRKPKLPLEDRCDARGCEVCGHARHDDRADRRRRNALAFCLCECLSGRLDGDGHGTFLCAAEAACVDAGTWVDPGIGGIHLLT